MLKIPMAGRQAGRQARTTLFSVVRPRVRHTEQRVLRIHCLPLAPLAQLSISYLRDYIMEWRDYIMEYGARGGITWELDPCN